MKSNKFNRKPLAAYLAGIFLAGEAGLAFAQLEEVMVTARKREEGLQDAPVVVAAFDRNALDRSAFADVQDLTAMVPGLRINASGEAIAPAINMRGIQTGATSTVNDQAVSLNIDGVQFSNAQVIRSGQFDLQQIEVLKGPQALFFGKNSPGGIIAMRTANPTEEFYAEAQLGYEFSAERPYGHVILSGPINDSWGWRLAGSYTDSEGYWENTFPNVANPDAPQFDEYIIRGTLQYRGENLEAILKYTTSQREGADYGYSQAFGCGPIAKTLVPGDDCRLNDKFYAGDPVDSAVVTAFTNNVFFPAIGAPPIASAYDQDISSLWKDEPYLEYGSDILSLQLEYLINDSFMLTSVTGYSEVNNKRFDWNLTGIPFAIVGDDLHDDVFSQELRLAFTGEKMNYMVGAFYDDRTFQNDYDLWFNSPPVFGVRPFEDNEVESTSWSVFAQFEFFLSEAFTLSVGGRYTEEEKEYTGVISQGNGAFLVPGLPGTPDHITQITPFVTGMPIEPAVDDLKFYDFSPEVTLSWQPEDNLNFFISYKEAFKSGGFDLSATDNQIIALDPERRIDFEPEEVTGFEAGMKSQWLDNSLRVNVAVFTYDYDDLQVSTFDVPTVSLRTVNAAAASVDGIEIETTYAPFAVDGLTLNAYVAWLDATYDEYIAQCSEWQISVTGAPGGCNVDADPGSDVLDPGVPGAGEGYDSQDRSGDPLRKASDWEVQLGANYDFGITDALRGKIDFNATWTDDFETDGTGDPRAIQEDFWLLNGGIGIYASDNTWSIDLIGRNLTDERIIGTGAAQPTGFGLATLGPPLGEPVPMFASLMPPREVLLQFTYRFQ